MINALLTVSMVTAFAATVNGFYCEGRAGYSLASGTNDLIVVQRSDGSFQSSTIHVTVGKFTSFDSSFSDREDNLVDIIIGGIKLTKDSGLPIQLKISRTGAACFDRPEYKDFLTDKDLKNAYLERDVFYQGIYMVLSLRVRILFSVFVINESNKIVISDVDGMLKETSLTYRLRSFFTTTPSISTGAAELFTKIQERGYTIIYTTERSYVKEERTKKYLFEKLGLPVAPLIMAPISGLKNMRPGWMQPRFDKTPALKNIFNLFNGSFHDIYAHNMVAGAYGDKESDKRTFLKLGISPELIWIHDNDYYLVNAKKSRPFNGLKTYKQHAIHIDQLYPRIN